MVAEPVAARGVGLVPVDADHDEPEAEEGRGVVVVRRLRSTTEPRAGGFLSDLEQVKPEFFFPESSLKTVQR